MSRLVFCSDLEKIYKGIGDNLALLIQWTSTFFAAIGVGLFRDWRLALVLLGVTPLLALSGGMFAKVCVCVMDEYHLHNFLRIKFNYYCSSILHDRRARLCKYIYTRGIITMYAGS